jgi:hypothetical protein
VHGFAIAGLAMWASGHDTNRLRSALLLFGGVCLFAAACIGEVKP